MQAPAIQTTSSRSDAYAVHRYAEDVVEGRIVAGPIVRDACARHIRDRDEGHHRGLKFDEDRAGHAMRFFPRILRLNGGQFEGRPFALHASQAFKVGSIFGWVNEDKTRRFRLAYIEEGKGNGKSPLVAGIGLYGMTSDGETRAEIYSAATNKDQAAILFRDAVAMVDQSPKLRDAIHKSGREDRVYNLFHRRSGSWFRPISSDKRKSGPRPHMGLIDELHEHRDAAVINMIDAGKKFRRQPLTVAITNSGHDKTSVCYEYHELAKQVCSGARPLDDFFAYVCALDEKDDPFDDESCWIKANPLLGVTIEPEYLRSQVNMARGLPSKESVVRRLNFCQWTEQHNQLIPLADWDACAENFSFESFKGCECWVGIDLSKIHDLTAAVFVFKRNGRHYWIPVFWVPREGLAKKANDDAIPYDTWVRQGWVRTTPGKIIDKDFVAADIAGLIRAHGLRVIEAPYDKYRIEELRASCARVGFSLPLVEFQQGFISMGPAVDELESGVVAHTIAHNGNPCLRWNIANAIAVEDPAGNRKLDKSQSTGRIDGAVAGIMANLRAKLSTSTKGPEIKWL